MKLCKDCKWSNPPSLFDRFLGLAKYARCCHPISHGLADKIYPVKINPVTGAKSGNPTSMYCSVMREVAEECGMNGNLWEARQ